MPSPGATELARERSTRAERKAPRGSTALLAVALSAVSVLLAVWVVTERRSDVREGLAAISYCAEGLGRALAAHEGALTEAEIRQITGPLVEWPGVSRLSLIQEPSGTPFGFDRSASGTPPESADRHVAGFGQVVRGERFALTRTYPMAAPYSVTLHIEGTLESLVRLHYERLTIAARVVVITAILGLLLAPWVARRFSLPWRLAVSAHVRALTGSDPIDDEPYCALEAAERFVAARSATVAAGVTQASAPFGSIPIGEVAHGLRTPLLALETSSTLLDETVLGPDQRALVRRIQLAAASLETLVEDLLDPASSCEANVVSEQGDFEPEHLVEELVAYVAPLARGRAIELLPRVDAAVARSVRGDAPRLTRALGHLLELALRRTERGVVDLRCAQVFSEGHTAELVFEVRSTAPLLSVSEHTEFQRRVAAGESRFTAGAETLPLGIHLASRVLRALGGEIVSYLHALEGGSFRCRVPVGIAVDPPLPPSLEGTRVLVIEERESSGAHLADLLTEEGAVVMVEASAYAGYEALHRGRPVGIILIHANLPGRDALLGGLEANALRGAPMPRVILVHPILGRRLPSKGLDEAVAAQLVEPVTRLALRRALHEASSAVAPSVMATGLQAIPLGATTKFSDAPVKVLLVDDNETNRQLVQFLLAKRGYLVDVAANGKEAVDAFALDEYDVVLMDCQMPVMDGLEATRRMRALEQGRARRTPILAMSAGTFGEDIQACRAAGMDDHIAKPFQPKMMLAWLERWVAAALDTASGQVHAVPRARVSAREAGLAPIDPPAPLPALEGAIDRSVLGPLLDDEGGRALAQDLKLAFERGATEVLQQIHTALVIGDLEQIGRLAHRFVSTSGTVGAVRLARLLRELETACRQGEGKLVRPLMERAEAELTVAQRALAAAVPT